MACLSVMGKDYRFAVPSASGAQQRPTNASSNERRSAGSLLGLAQASLLAFDRSTLAQAVFRIPHRVSLACHDANFLRLCTV